MSSLWQGGEHITDRGDFTMKREIINGIGGAEPGSIGTIFFGTISGGAGAALTGGNFWQGAVTGMIVSGLNHTLHDKINPTRKKLNHEETIKYFKKEIASYEKGIDKLNIALDAVGGDYSFFGVVRDFFAGTLKFSVLSLSTTHLKIEIKNMEKNLSTLRNIKQKYDDFHAKNPGSSKGITIQETRFTFTTSVYGGYNPGTNYIQYIDNYYKMSLGTINTLR